MSTTAIAITWEVFHDGEFIGDVHLISKGLFDAISPSGATASYKTKRSAIAWLVRQCENGEQRLYQ